MPVEPSFPDRETPAWLRELRIEDPAPLAQMLEGSAFYPCSARDGDPIRYLGKLTPSFVYVDYSLKAEEILESLHSTRQGVRGYSIAGFRALDQTELDPGAWVESEAVEAFGGRRHPGDTTFDVEDRYALWVLLDRSPDVEVGHGPARLSLLFIGGEAFSAYCALFLERRLSPRVMCLIQPGMNWTDFTDHSGVFARMVRSNPGGLPDYLLCGGYAYYNQPEAFLPGYGEALFGWHACETYLRLFRRQRGAPSGQAFVRRRSRWD